MANLNKVMLIGNLTRDPELKYLPKGTAVADLGLAINRNWTTDDGQKREECTFLDVTFFGKQAETLAKYMTKGKPLYVEARLQLDQWDDRDTGQKRSKLKLIGESFQFLGGKDDSSSSGGDSQTRNYGSTNSRRSSNQESTERARERPSGERIAKPPAQKADYAMDEQDDIPF